MKSCIQGYGVLRKDRDRHGGGVAVYVKDSIPYKSLQLIHQDLEAGPPVFLTPADTI